MNRQGAPALFVLSIMFLVFGTPSSVLAQSIKNAVDADTIFRHFLFFPVCAWFNVSIFLVLIHTIPP